MKVILDYIKKYKYYILCLITILIVSGFVLIYVFKDNSTDDASDLEIVMNEDVVEEEVIEEEILEKVITVDIKGEVNNPGVYKLPIGSRVIDAIELSGGTTKKADTSDINLSKVLNDENVIVVNNKYSTEKIKYIEKECNCPSTSSICINDEDVINKTIDSKDSSLESGKISINKATKEELMTLSGIGESKALDIINYRNENGLFKNIEELKNISGIGDKLFEKFKDQITI